MSNITRHQYAESTFEWRHEASGHFIARARNAHFNAALLRKLPNDILESIKEAVGFDRAPASAVYEGYIREIGVALELAVKAVICRRIEARKQGDNGLPHHHRLVDLWETASLPSLSEVERFQLFRLGIHIEWAGRYATARKEVADNQAFDCMLKLERLAYSSPQSNDSFNVREVRGTDEAVLERLYDVAIGQALAS